MHKAKFDKKQTRLNVCLLAVLGLLITACNPEPSTSNDQTIALSVTNAALEMAEPEQVGMDSGRLNRVTKAMQAYVDDGLLAGVVTMAARDNKLVHYESVGYRDLESQALMTNDAIFRIYSMSKPVTGVALMILYEEGKFRLADPVEKYIPEFRGLQVYKGVDT